MTGSVPLTYSEHAFKSESQDKWVGVSINETA